MTDLWVKAADLLPGDVIRTRQGRRRDRLRIREVVQLSERVVLLRTHWYEVKTRPETLFHVSENTAGRRS